MKLRNKKTGEIKSIEEIIRDAFLSNELDSLKNIDANWEEIEPKESLIKDEKIRKAVRAWAEAVDRTVLLVIKTAGRLEISDGSLHLIYISFHADEETLKGLDDRMYYTIEELCGSEE